MRTLFGLGIAAVFALGSFSCLVELGAFIDDIRQPPTPVVHKVFVPPPPPAVKTVEPPELPPESVPQLHPVTLPGIELPKK